MTFDTPDTLLALLRRVELLAPEQVDEIARELVPFYPDPISLGEYLVRIDWLTPYQLQLLLAGQWMDLTIGPYQILDRLGEGGLSEVFKAWDTQRGRVVALKVLRQDLTTKSDAVRQFQQEFKAITRLSHPNVIKTYEAGQEGRLHFFAMEFVEGMDLERFVAQVGPLPVDVACDFARQAATGLQHAHQAGLVHRDVKPANLFLLNPPLPGNNGSTRKAEPVVKIIDWGLARCLRDPSDPNAGAGDDTEEQKGALIGTADYVAPEQARNPTLVDVRADTYSLGCSLYFLLTGQVPFPAPSLMQKLLMHQEKEPPSLRAVRNDVPEELDAIVRKMLAKNPTDRYQIPLLVVTPLRRFCRTELRPSSNGIAYRPGSAPAMQRPGSANNLPRPTAPGTAINLPRPATQASLNRPGQNGTK
jgi:eukaryotic-like serine/threonine-protein kinase